MSRECRFCRRLSIDGAIASWDRPLMQTDNFVVWPSLGALVEGWLLVLPKNHYLTMRSLSSELRQEAADVLEETSRLVARLYNPPTVFEHGPRCGGLDAGCGIDHAHFHVVPLSFDLHQETERLFAGKFKWDPVGSLFAPRVSKERASYLYISLPDSSQYIAWSNEIPRQTFRRVIAEELGLPGSFDWSEHPRIETVERTRSRISEAVESSEGEIHVGQSRERSGICTK